MVPQVPNDSLSFVYIPKGWTFQYFEHTNYGGATRIFGRPDTAVALSMSGHNDWVSSFKTRQLPSSGQVMLCQHNPCGTGGKFYASTGNWANMPSVIGCDQLSFVYIPPGFVFRYFEHPNYGGWSNEVKGGQNGVNLNMNGHNDAVSSFIIALE
jgi:hypothetical protein